MKPRPHMKTVATPSQHNIGTKSLMNKKSTQQITMDNNTTEEGFAKGIEKEGKPVIATIDSSNPRFNED